jgi:hypothetical protein
LSATKILKPVLLGTGAGLRRSPSSAGTGVRANLDMELRMRKRLLASAILPLGTLACVATPVSAQTVVQREVIITEREVPATTIIERRYRTAPNVRYYRAPRDTEVRSGYLNVVERGDCGWLHRRAVETGSDYWWERYNDCRNDD